MRTRMLAAAIVFASVAAPCAIAGGPNSETMVVVKNEDLVWKDYPGLPGVRFAVVFGDPSKEGPYTIRVMFAPGVMSRPHYHPEARYVTVLKGTWWAGAGDKFDRDNTVPLPAGTFAMHYPRKVHYDGAKDEEVLVQISGIGPSGTIPVNPGEAPK
jgi:quercetin dioxygenase-like cupin family protein